MHIFCSLHYTIAIFYSINSARHYAFRCVAIAVFYWSKQILVYTFYFATGSCSYSLIIGTWRMEAEV